ncbi:hypothetical protein [Rhodoblastus sp.]|uniref:hypothetical protein n=1 Tax=Rhodoblastus sp. TaxID=1962975 RepID=UPI002630BFCE|nr:hypothetical protein [Rhodoblastus sp.]
MESAIPDATARPSRRIKGDYRIFATEYAMTTSGRNVFVPRPAAREINESLMARDRPRYPHPIENPAVKTQIRLTLASMPRAKKAGRDRSRAA